MVHGHIRFNANLIFIVLQHYSAVHLHVYVSHKPHLLGSLTGPVDRNHPGQQSLSGLSAGRTRTDDPL